MLGRILVGYTTTVRPDALQRAGGDEKITQKRIRCAYWGQLDRVIISDPLHQRMQAFPVKGKSKISQQPIAVQIKHWLYSAKAYQAKVLDGECPFIFLGFNIKDFVKLLGAECGEAGDPLDDVCWLGWANYKDIASCAVTSDQAKLGVKLEDPLRLYGIAERYKLDLPYTPMKDAAMDLKVTWDLAAKLGQLTRINDVEMA